MGPLKYHPILLNSWINGKSTTFGRTLSSSNTGKDRTLASDNEKRILLNNCYLPGDLEEQISRFVEVYNNQRLYESLNNLTPAEVYFGRGHAILAERERIKKQTIQNRRLIHQIKAA
jgi:transposase InsO family protein